MQGQGRKNINPFYQSSAWRKLRHAFKVGISIHLGTPNPHPNSICIECFKEGKITATHTVDHIKPINQANAYNTMNGRYGEALTWENLQPLCEHHNAKKTGKERHGK
jgi:5-methylcytosine-specific restriction endonuclease McrA